MASPVFERQGLPAGALVLTGPAERLPPERREDLGERLRAAANQLSASA
jgi:DNA-binding IclR family transcriptional regulator